MPTGTPTEVISDLQKGMLADGNDAEPVSIKVEELFNLCDHDKKGYIIRKDMQCLQDQLGVNSEQLEDVFNSLDIDHNGFLTLDEFSGQIDRS